MELLHLGFKMALDKVGFCPPCYLFTVYLDELLQRLSALDIDCHVGHHYVESLYYADDIALHAPSPSALILLRECELFATEHNLLFNAAVNLFPPIT